VVEKRFFRLGKIQEEYQSRTFKARMPRVKEQWLKRRRGDVLPCSTRVDRVALEPNGVTTPLSRHGKVSSPPRSKLIPNPPTELRPTTSGLLVYSGWLHFRSIVCAQDCPLLFSTRVFLLLSPHAILTNLLVQFSPICLLFLSLVNHHIYFNQHCDILVGKSSMFWSYQNLFKTQIIPISSSGWVIEIVSRL